MGKIELQNKIKNARSRIADIEHEIYVLSSKIEIFIKDKGINRQNQELANYFYDSERVMLDYVSVAKGNCNTSAVNIHSDLFSIRNRNIVDSKYEDINIVLEENIKYARERIDELTSEKQHLIRCIKDWNNDIKEEEKKEEMKKYE